MNFHTFYVTNSSKDVRIVTVFREKSIVFQKLIFLLKNIMELEVFQNEAK